MRALIECLCVPGQSCRNYQIGIFFPFLQMSKLKLRVLNAKATQPCDEWSNDKLDYPALKADVFSTAPPCLPRDDALDLFLSFLVLSLGLAQHPNGTLTSWMSMPLMPVEGHCRDVQAELIRGLLTKQIPSLVLFTLLTCLPRILQQLTLHLSAGGKHLPSANQKAPLAIV